MKPTDGRAGRQDRQHAGRPRTSTPPATSEARFDSVLDTAVDGIVVIDEQGRILVYNKSCERLFGYAAAEVIGRNVKMIMPPHYAEAHDGYIHHYRRPASGGSSASAARSRGMHRDGTVFPVELSVGEAVSDDGRQFIGIIRDLRPRKSFEQRLSQLQAELVAHGPRLRHGRDGRGAGARAEPAAHRADALPAGGRRARSGPPTAPETAKVVPMLDKAVAEAERAAGIIQRMRQFVEKREPERSDVDLRKVVDEAVELSDFVAQGSTVRILRAYGPEPLEVDVDPIQIQQIVINLLRNAFEVARDSAERWVEVVAPGDGGRRADVMVPDNGPGIPSEAVQNLFRTFSTSKRTGMGLGLSISRTIAQNHGGDLTVDPGGNGRGRAPLYCHCRILRRT